MSVCALLKYTCARCGRIKSAANLQVHHLTYERLGNELPSDLQVLCHACHWEADKERKAAGPTAREEGYDHSKLRAGFNGWMTNGGHEDWYDMYDYTIIHHAQQFLASIGLDPNNPALIEASCGVERMKRSRVQRLLAMAAQEMPRIVWDLDDFGYVNPLAQIVGMRELS